MSPTKKPWLRLAVLVLVALALVVPAAMSQAPPVESKRVVTVLVVDSLDQNIGKSVAKDGELVKQTLEDGFHKDKDRLVLHPTIDGNKVTPDGILEFINNLPVEKTDTLFFYYSGHGAWDPDKGQYLQMYSGPPDKKGDLFRSTLVAKLKAKNARLTMLVTDCCNAVVPSRAPVARDLAKPAQWETLRCLLLRPQGVVDMTSSAKGQVSLTWGEDAKGNALPSMFTVNLVGLFRAKLKEGASLDWEYAHGWLKKVTQDDYSKRRESFFGFYNKLPKEQKAEFAQAADFFRKQDKQTVYSYSLPSK